MGREGEIEQGKVFPDTRPVPNMPTGLACMIFSTKTRQMVG